MSFTWYDALVMKSINTNMHRYLQTDFSLIHFEERAWTSGIHHISSQSKAVYAYQALGLQLQGSISLSIIFVSLT